MAKKVRRVRKKKKAGQSPSAATSSSSEASAEETVPAESTPPADREMESSKQTAEERLREEYAYVVLDLRRIAILAAAMFILLILLNVLL